MGIPGEVVGSCSRKWQRRETPGHSYFSSSIFIASILAANIFATYLIGYKAILPLKRKRLKGREDTW